MTQAGGKILPELHEKFAKYVLSRIAAQVGGESLSSLVSRRLFAPMGIGSFFWERSPEGYEKGGWGLYLSCEDWAKLGLLMERGGRWNGAQLLSEEFVRQATSIRNPASTVQKKHFAYGWQLWVDKRENGDFLFNGMLGQNVLVSPAADLVISMASANNEIFQDSPSLELILSFADEMRSGIGAPRHDREGVRLLRERENSFFSARAEAHPLPRGKKPPLLRALPFLGRFFGREEPIPPVYRPFIGKKLLVGHSTIGALPLFVRLLDNNLAGRLNALYLREDGERLLLDLTEGGKEQTIPVGLRGYAEGTLEKNGERYLVRTLAEAEYAPPPLPSGGEDGKTAGGVSRLRIEIVFPELPATHTLVLTEEDGEILLANRETPGSGIADSFLLKLRERKDRLSSLLALLERKYGAGFPERLLAALFEPQVVCVDARDERREEKLAARRAAEEKKISFLRKLFGLTLPAVS